MFIAYSDYICALQIGLITKGAKDRIRLVEEIKNRVELGDLSFVHYEDTVVISWNVDGLKYSRAVLKKEIHTNGVEPVGDA